MYTKAPRGGAGGPADGEQRPEPRAVHLRTGAAELTAGVALQALVVGLAAVLVRSPTMPLLPIIGFNNLVPDPNGPRLLGTLCMLAASLLSLALGVLRWTE